MAGAQKNFELLFKLTASLGGNFHQTFNAAAQAQKRLSDSVKNVNALQSKIDGYNKANAAIQPKGSANFNGQWKPQKRKGT